MFAKLWSRKFSENPMEAMQTRRLPLSDEDVYNLFEEIPFDWHQIYDQTISYLRNGLNPIVMFILLRGDNPTDPVQVGSEIALMKRFSTASVRLESGQVFLTIYGESVDLHEAFRIFIHELGEIYLIQSGYPECHVLINHPDFQDPDAQPILNKTTRIRNRIVEVAGHGPINTFLCNQGFPEDYVRTQHHQAVNIARYLQSIAKDSRPVKVTSAPIPEIEILNLTELLYLSEDQTSTQLLAELTRVNHSSLSDVVECHNILKNLNPTTPITSMETIVGLATKFDVLKYLTRAFYPVPEDNDQLVD